MTKSPEIRHAFTLIELLIVIAIVAILALIAIPNFLEAQTRAKVSRVHADMRSLATAIEAYMTDHNSYPIMCQNFDPLSFPKNFSNTLWCTNKDGAFSSRTKYLAFCLTTPIAYIATFPLDPFSYRYLDWWDTSHENISYFYNNFHGAAIQRRGGEWTTTYPQNGWGTDPAPVTAPARVMLDRGGPIVWLNWMLVSAGPDNRVNTGRMGYSVVMYNREQYENMETGGLVPYDPTNGLTSRGVILRGDKPIK